MSNDNEDDPRFVERRDPKVCAAHMKMMNEHSTEIALLKQSMVTVVKSVDSINSNVAKLIWIVIGAIAMAGMTFLIRGGLHV